MMKIINEEFNLVSREKEITFINITDLVKKTVEESGVREGLCLVSTSHTTCSVLFEEQSLDINYRGYEFLQQDLMNVLDELIPKCKMEGDYIHPGPNHIDFGINGLKGEISPEPYTMLNTDAHLKSSLIGKSEILNIKQSELNTGTIGSIYFIDWDQNRSRTRICCVTVIGEG